MSMTIEELAATRATIWRAGSQERLLGILYRDSSGEVSMRDVEPYSIRTTKDGNECLMAVNGDDAIRAYRLDRIVSAVVLDEQFEPRVGADGKVWVVEFGHRRRK